MNATAAKATDSGSFHFSTRGLTPAEGIAAWYRAVGRSAPRRAVAMVADTPCEVDVTVHNLGGSGSAGHTWVHRLAVSGPMRACRSGDLLSDGNDDVVLHLQERGRRIVDQLGREATAQPHGGFLSSNSDASCLVSPEPSRFTNIALPRRTMLAMAPGLEDALARPLGQDSASLRLLLTYLDALDDPTILATPEMRRMAGVHVQDLCALAIGTSGDAREAARSRGLRAARLQAIKADIVEHLADGELTAAALAARQQITPRYVHKLFEREGTTLSRFVLGQRLARVHRMLADPRLVDQPVSGLAYAVGFGDLSTFNRAFRRHFGATPSDVRLAAKTEW